MRAKKLYDKFMITSMVAGFEPVEVISASGCTIRGGDSKPDAGCRGEGSGYMLDRFFQGRGCGAYR